VPPPREYLIILAALAATGIPVGLTGALREGALVAGGAVLAGLVTLAPALPRRRAIPQTRALSRAWTAVAGVLGTAGTPGAAGLRGRAVADVSQAREVLREAGATADDRPLRSLAAAEIVLASALSVSIEAREPLDPAWAAAVRRLGALTPDHAPACRQGPAADAAARMPQVQAETLLAVAEVFRGRWLGESAGPERAQRRLAGKLLDLRTITEDMLADQVIGAPATRREQVTLAIEELAMLALGIPFSRRRPSRTDAEALVGRLEQLAGALGRGLPAPDADPAPELPDYPRTRAATELLALAIS
jgi:hypothetical protein